MNKELSRQELYDLVWLKPMTTLAKEFNLSDNGLRKICKKHDIPVPNVGYWAKVQYGKNVVKTGLPKHSKNNNPNIVIDVYEGLKATEKRIDLLPEILSNKKLILNVSPNLSKPDQLILNTKEELEIEQRPWNDPLTRFRNSKNRLNISVSTKELPRALRIFNNLIKNLEILNYQVECNCSGTEIISFDNLNLKISLREKSNATYTVNNNGWRDRKLTPNGLFCLKIEESWHIKEFYDNELVKLEDKIPNILAKIEELFQKERKEKEEREIARKEHERLEEIARALQKAKEDELNMFLEFYKSAHRWDHYMILKKYYDMIESTFMDNNDDSKKEWLAWAKKKLDWYNPTLDQEDALLKDVDKETLEFKKKESHTNWYNRG